MFKRYLTTAWRSLFHHKLYTGLNIAGLTFGISCFLLLGLYLFDELSFDRYHSKADRIYRVIEHRRTNNEELTIAGASFKLSQESQKIPGVETTTRISRLGRDNISNPQKTQNKFQETITYCDANLFKVFDFNFIDGDPATALNEPNSVVLTATMAQKLFGNTHVVGKTVKIDFLEPLLTVTAVVKDHPSNSSFDFTYLLNEATFKNSEDYKRTAASDWSSNQFLVYALLAKNVRPENIAPAMDRLVHENYKPEQNVKMDYWLQPLADMHLDSENIVDGARNSNVAAISQGRLLYVKIFAIVALFVLLIACINYVNLTTARFASRSKEVGIRKAIGAFRGQLIYQFLTESLLVSLLAFVLSVGVVNLVLPAFNQFTGKQLSLGLLTDYRIWLYSFLTAIAVALLSGIYPSLLLSRFNPVLLLKGGARQNDKNGLSLRKGLVVFQFTISVIMIIATMVLIMQVHYVNNKDLGFNKDQLVVVDINSGIVRRESHTIQTEFSKIPGVKNVSVTSRVPGEWKTIPTIKVKQEQGSEYQISYLLGVDEMFEKTFEVKFLNGRNFLNANDSASVILNETAAAMLNIKEASNQIVDIPERAMGGTYRPVQGGPFKAKVIGIVKDFNFQSLREKIAPLVLAYRNNPVHVIDYYTARIEGRYEASILKQMEIVLTKIDAEHLLEYHFLDEQLALFYTEDRRRETLLIGIALATIFIACLGLFGLATYAATQRIKEIGVRKVLGASLTQLTSLLAKDFLKLVLIANGLAFPVAWWATNKWLQEFAYHINIEWWVFVFAGIAALLIALITVSFQAIKAARANPVKSLRTE
ncbi:MAG: FtsX-like permease family protein [Sediminibacterium sp.]